jgi:Domain of unknown function (DUF4365)
VLTAAHRQEGLSRAYVQAVAARCGMSYSCPTPDYGIDLSLHEIVVEGARRFESGYRLDIQAKSTTQSRVEPAAVRYDLEVAAYDTLRSARVVCPRILVVLVLPADESQWLSLSEDEMILRRCAYWLSLTGSRPTTNRRSIRLRIPRTNTFTVESLQGILARIKAGGSP